MSNECLEDNYFDSEDVDILSDALKLIPDLEISVYATKVAQKKLKFPLESHENLKPLLMGSNQTLNFRDRKIDYEQMVKFLPKHLFPILDEKDFLRKVIIGFGLGAIHHRKAQIALRQRQSKNPVTMLIPPGYSIDLDLFKPF
jgi:hypothetical protein